MHKNSSGRTFLNFLVKYKDREGHCTVLQSRKEKGEDLGTWLSKQRVLKNKDKLDNVKQKQFEDLGVKL